MSVVASVDPVVRSPRSKRAWASRAIVLTLLRLTRHGSLALVDGDRVLHFGRAGEDAPDVRVVVHDRRVYRALLRASLGLSEAYANGWFDCSDLPELARLAALNMPASDRWRRALRPVVALPQAAVRWIAAESSTEVPPNFITTRPVRASPTRDGTFFNSLMPAPRPAGRRSFF